MTARWALPRRGMIAAAAALLVALGVALAPGKASAETIKIGVITDRVGGAKFWATAIGQGIQMGTEEINKKGGVLGKKIELLWEDDQNKPDVSATKARKLIEAGVVFIMSITSSPVTQQAQTATAAAKMPHMTPANSADYLTKKLKNPYFWQTGPLGSTQIKTLMAYTKKRNYKRVAIVTDNTGLGTFLAKIFKGNLEKAGITVVAHQVIERGSTDAVAQLQKVRAAKPQAIFHAGIAVPEMALFFRAYHQLGLKQPIMGSFNLSVPAYLKVVPGMLEGVAFIDAMDPDKKEAKAFIAKYKAKYGKTPFALPAYGYDGIHLIADAIKRAGSTDKAKIRAAMQSIDNWVGVLGAKGTSISFKSGRAGFSQEGAVVRIIKNNTHGPAVFSGTK